jgi:ABC-type molybdate transport system substrate-binding protein
MTSRVTLFAAGSLHAALGELAGDFEASTGTPVDPVFGPSGLLRKRIEAGERADVFASADMEHPRMLEAAGRAGRVRCFARNVLCVLVRPGLDVDADTLLEAMRRPDIRLGTSTPGADPSGDYAWRLFARAEAVEPGAAERLAAKALQLTGGQGTEPPPTGRNVYAWIVESGRADLFLTYRTNAVLARDEAPSLQIVDVPDVLSVGADYGISVISGAPDAAADFVEYVLSPEGRNVLAGFGFGMPGN